MSDLTRLDAAELQRTRAELLARYQQYQSRRLKLDMTRGKPCPEQLDLALSLLDMLDDRAFRAEDGTDCRNYGGVDGLPEAKRLFAEYLQVAPDEILIGGNASLAMMYDAIGRAMLKGVGDGHTPWARLPAVKFLCPAPGYDRHFSICEYYNIEMIPIELRHDGPDMDTVERLVGSDAAIKSMFCVPKYSNPTGVTYSDETVDRLASLKTLAPDFRIIWDNAYNVHHLTDRPAPLKNMLAACKQAGNPDRVLIFGSTSKITIAGGGLAMMAGSKKNMDLARKHISVQTIGPDKLNQLRHVRFLRNMAGIEALMRQHAAILRPKFDAVIEVLDKELGDKNVAQWTRPNGGYFISLDTLDGCARAVVKLADEAGVKLTPAGSTFPYGRDPRDCNIRLAPSFPKLDEIRQAMELFAICVQLASVEKLLRVQ